MTVYECELAVLHQHQQALFDEAARTRMRGQGLSLRSRVALMLRDAADRVEPAHLGNFQAAAPAAGQHPGVLA
jgi:hypothetical protein